jgi:hypothetical protein
MSPDVPAWWREVAPHGAETPDLVPTLGAVQQAPSKIHIASQAYLVGWTVDGLLKARDVRSDHARPKAPAAVAWRRDWWGANNPQLNSRAEQECGKIETLLPAVLADIEHRWPLANEERFALSMFIALHVLRTPAFLEWLEDKRGETLEDYRDQFSTARKFERFREVMLSDGERAKRILSMVNKISTILACMNWTLLRFDEPLLITSDHPVCPVPLIEEGQDRAIHPIPGDGWMNTIEVRFPLTPHLALLATWHMSEPQPPISGRWEHAVNLNAAVRVQADRHWLYTPARMPALPPAVFSDPIASFLPIAPAVLPGYNVAAAKASKLREGTQKEIDKLIESQDAKTITMITLVKNEPATAETIR